LSRHRNELRGDPKSAGPRPWPILPMRKFVPDCSSVLFVVQ